jgi:hypothetical protein
MLDKISKMKAHLKNCQNISNETHIQAISELLTDKENVPTCSALPILNPSTSACPLKRLCMSTFSFGDDIASQWSTSLQEDFGNDLLKLFMLCRFSWNSVSNPQMGLFVQKWIPGTKVPGCKALSGHILDREVARVEARTRE